MKDGFARAIAIVALVFMGIFVGSLVATLADNTLLNGGIAYLALASGVFTFMLFIALKADGRGFSLSRMKTDEQMEQIYKALDEKNAEAQKSEASEHDETSDENEASQPLEVTEQSEAEQPPEGTEND